MIGTIGATPLPMAQSVVGSGSTGVSVVQGAPVSISASSALPSVPRSAYSVPGFQQAVGQATPIPTVAPGGPAVAPASLLPPVFFQPGERIPLFPTAPTGPSKAEIAAAAAREHEREERQRRNLLIALLLAAVVGYGLYSAGKSRGKK